MLVRKTLISPCLLVAILTGAGLTQSARADGTKDILKLVPQDAWLVVVARSLDNVDKKAAQLKEALGLEFPTPVTPMALGMLNLGDTIDTSQPLCAVLMDVQKFGDPNDAAVILIPAKDPKALLARLAAEEGEEAEGADADDDEAASTEPLAEGISKCTLMGEPAYAATKGKIVIFGPSQECVTKVFKAKKTMAENIAPVRLKSIDQSDLYVSIALGDIVAAYKPMFLPMIQMMAAPSGPQAAKGLEAVVKMFEEMSAMDISVTFDEGGFSLAFLAAARKGSDLEKLFGDTKNTGESLLSCLPKEKYLLALGGTNLYSEHAVKFGGENPISTAIKAQQIEGLDEDALKTVDAEYLKLTKAIRRWAISVSLLPSGSDGMFAVAKVLETEDAKEFVEGCRRLYKAAMSASDDEDFETIKACIIHTADAETIGGSKVDTFKVDLEKLTEAFDFQKDWVEKVTKLIGKDILLRLGAVDNKRVVVSFGGGTERFKRISEAFKSGDKALSTDAGIAALSKRLPSPRSQEIFIAVDNVGQMLSSVSKALGEEEEFPFDVPSIDAPVAIATAIQGNISRMDLIVPMKLIKMGKELFEQYAASAATDDFDVGDEDEEQDLEEEKEANKAA